jgi:hypothetical protein
MDTGGTTGNGVVGHDIENEAGNRLAVPIGYDACIRNVTEKGTNYGGL